MTITLNKKQDECVKNLLGSYLVLAGPGTGKTFTIINRIYEIIKKGINPSKILCLTFTDAANKEMQIRLEKMLSDNKIKLDEEVKIRTYHGFCNEIIENNFDIFELPNNLRTITDSISRALIKECIDELDPKAFRTDKNDPYYFIPEIKNKIDEIKKNRLNKEKYFYNIENNLDWKPCLKKYYEQLKEKQEKGRGFKTLQEVTIPALEKKIQKAIELWDFFELYNKKMQSNRFIDFNDMINFVLDKFEKNPAFLQKIASEFEYILVDEYQDTNTAQNQIVFDLASNLPSKNIFVVGDDNQIIYSFQGAKLNTIENFLKNFKDTKVICLNENMRSNQNILDVARIISLKDDKNLENNPEFKKYNIDKNLISKRLDLPNNKVKITAYNDIEQEYISIVDEIEKLSKNKENLSEIAILAKSNAELEEFASLLKNRDIPYELKEGKNIFEIKASALLFYYMQFLINPELYSNNILKTLLLSPFNIHPKDYEKICACVSFNKSLIDNIKLIDDFKEPNKIQNFLKTYEHLRNYIQSENLINCVLEIASCTGIFDYYLNNEINQSENIASLKKMVEEAQSFSDINKMASLADFINYLQVTIDDEIIIKTQKAPVDLNAVQLSTYHSAKGREFEIVFMPTIVKRKWESSSSKLKPEIPLNPNEYKDEEELKALKRSDLIKVMYVGMTRAKHSLNLSYIKGNKSELIQNLKEDLIVENEMAQYNVLNYWQQIKKSLTRKSYDYKRDFNSLIDAILKDKFYSPTSINCYLNCPRQYLYKEILNLSTKAKNADTMHYGTAIHNTLQYGFNYALKHNIYPKEEEIINTFKKNLDKLPLSTIENRINIEKRGQEALKKYYPQFVCSPVQNLVEAEKKITFGKFKGIIDRIEKKQDGTYIICDYKTGNAKSAKKISPDGEYASYYNQIALYKYLFEKATNLNVSEVKFIFPEDFENNLSLTFTKEEIEEVEKLANNVIKAIEAHYFEPNEDKIACKYCEFKSFCNFNVV